jgi:predicted nucleic acid-binding Zn ribbon protein
MARRIYEFKCSDAHISDKYVDEETQTVTCDTCGLEAKRILSMPMMKLEGCSGDYPTASDAWVRKRAEKQRIEQKQNS